VEASLCLEATERESFLVESAPRVPSSKFIASSAIKVYHSATKFNSGMLFQLFKKISPTKITCYTVTLFESKGYCQDIDYDYNFFKSTKLKMSCGQCNMKLDLYGLPHGVGTKWYKCSRCRSNSTPPLMPVLQTSSN